MNDSISSSTFFDQSTLIWGAPQWAIPAALIALVFVIGIVWSYARSTASTPIRLTAAALKLTAVALMLLCLLQPMRRGERPRPQANLFPILVDTSQSMQLRDAANDQTRGETLADLLSTDNDWRIRLDQMFDVRTFGADSRLSRLDSTQPLAFDGTRSSLLTSINALSQRLGGRPIAGMLLLSDGNLTDATENLDLELLPFPIYPIVPESATAPSDLRLSQVSVTQSDFESSPITLRGNVMATGIAEISAAGKTATVQLLNRDGKLVEEQSVTLTADDEPASVTFRFRPDEPGTQFYQLRATSPAITAEDEATLKNNSRWVAVERKQGPFRILYLAGRPNWDFKFLRRALQSDAETQLVGLLRVADKEAKFSFRDKGVNDSNPLFAGLGSDEEETREQYDEAVMIRLGVKESEELSQGFPETADELFGYHGIILDDIEPEFFTQDQMLLLRQFVSVRGGGLLMLGGQESFNEDSFGKTPLGELSPVYAPTRRPDEPAPIGKWTLTREGMLQPWQRLRETEAAEKMRLAKMPPFRVTHQVGDIKPGAVQMAQLEDASGQTSPAIATQRFGKGRTAAMLVGDFWRWSMRHDPASIDGASGGALGGKTTNDDPAQAWRQITRWLVGEVPRRVEMKVEQDPTTDAAEIRVTVRDESFLPLDNASVSLTVIDQDGKEVTLNARPDATELGVYVAPFIARDGGRFLAIANVKAADQSFIGTEQTGWVSDPGAGETERLAWNKPWLQQVAASTGGEIVRPSELAGFVAKLSNKKVPVTETWVYPLWHQTWVMILAMACLCGEWGLRRWKGMA